MKPLCLRDSALAALDGVCYNPDAAHRYRFATHSFNGWRCCPIPTFAKTSLGNSFASSLHSHVASMLRRLIGLTFIAHRMMARNWRCLVDDKRFPVSAPWVRRGTRSISPMPAAAALLQSICSGSLNVAQPLSDIELQAARRHFFGGIATNCLNNSEFVPLSPSSSPLRTASSSPNVALFNVLPLARKRCCRGVQTRQADFVTHANDLTAHRSHIPLGYYGVARSRSVGRWGMPADGGRGISFPCTPNLLSVSSVALFSALLAVGKRKFCRLNPPLLCCICVFYASKFSVQICSQTAQICVEK